MRNILIELESVLIKKFKPTFLSVLAEENATPSFIHVVISARQFSDVPVDKRVALVYKHIMDENPQLLEHTPVIVETFSSSEMVDLFEYIK